MTAGELMSKPQRPLNLNLYGKATGNIRRSTCKIKDLVAQKISTADKVGQALASLILIRILSVSTGVILSILL